LVRGPYQNRLRPT